MKKGVPAKKKDESQPKDPGASDAELSKDEGGEKAPDPVIVGAKAKNRFRRLIGITGTRSMQRRRNDNFINGAAMAVV
jgi:hypothetical protein